MDKISGRGLKFFAYHGVFEDEKKSGQTFYADFDIFLDTSLCNGDLKNSVHYGNFSLDLIDFCKNNQYELLETLVENLSKYLLLKYPLIKTLSLTVHKPEAPIPTEFDDISITVERGWNKCFIALGSNLGDKEGYLNFACDEIMKDDCFRNFKKSKNLVTKPYGVLDQPDFLNCVLVIDTIYTPQQLLAFCQNLEKKAKRVRKRHWGERTLDVDILFYSNQIIDEVNLIVPHPDLINREFVLNPLNEIAPYFIHPVYRKNIKELLDELNKKNS